MSARAFAERAPFRPAGVTGALVCIGAAATSGMVLAVTGNAVPLLAAATLALGVLLLLRPEIGTLLFLGLLWANVPGVLARFHGLPDLVAEATIALLVIPVARYLLQREPVIITPGLVAMLFYLAANLLSAAMSSNPVLAVEAVITLLGEGLLIYVLISNAVRTPRVARWSVSVLVMVAVMMAGLSVHQEVTEAYGDAYLGFAQNTRQEDPVTIRPNPDARPRMTGPIGEQNRYAQILLVVLPLALFGLSIRHPIWGRLVPLVAGVAIVAGVFLTFSRGAAVALALLIAVLVVWRYVRLSHMLAIVSAFVLTVVIVAPEFLARAESIQTVSSWVSGEGDDPDGAILGRATSNVAALLVFVDYPIVGVGPGVYASDYSIDYANQLGLRYFETTRRAHNMYLEWAAELGIVGLTVGVSMIAIALAQLASLRSFWLPRRREYADLAGAFSLALIAYSSTAIFLHLSYQRYFFGFLALANSVIWILERERRATSEAM